VVFRRWPRRARRCCKRFLDGHGAKWADGGVWVVNHSGERGAWSPRGPPVRRCVVRSAVACRFRDERRGSVAGGSWSSVALRVGGGRRGDLRVALWRGRRCGREREGANGQARGNARKCVVVRGVRIDRVADEPQLPLSSSRIELLQVAI